MEETLEGGRGPPQAVAPLEEEEGYCVCDTCFAEVLQINSFLLTKHIFLKQ